MMIERPHADLDHRTRFGCDIGLARRIVAEEYDGKPRNEAMRGGEPARFRGHSGA